MEIMEKEGGSLVDRPIVISAGDTLSGGMRILLARAGNRFRKMRRCVSLIQNELLSLLYVLIYL
jgi:hypothetical protein